MRTHRKGGCRCLTLSEPIQLEVGLQIPRGVYPEEAAEGIVWQTPPSPRGDFPCLGPAERVSDSGRTSAAGSCQYVHCDSPEAPGGFGDRVP